MKLVDPFAPLKTVWQVTLNVKGEWLPKGPLNRMFVVRAVDEAGALQTATELARQFRLEVVKHVGTESVPYVPLP